MHKDGKYSDRWDHYYNQWEKFLFFIRLTNLWIFCNNYHYCISKLVSVPGYTHLSCILFTDCETTHNATERIINYYEFYQYGYWQENIRLKVYDVSNTPS